MTRYRIYTRYSTERQNESSTEAQVSLSRAFGDRKGWTLVGVYSDEEISGASTEGRDDYARLMADVENDHGSIIVAEDLDRLSRNLGDTERLRERMEFIGVTIHTIFDGEITQINATLKGLTSAIFLKGHAQRMRGRMAELARKGLSAGGLTYGYAPGPVKGSRVIVESEAEIVRRIFAEYLADRSPRDIAARLNAEAVPPPRGRDWLSSSINGNPVRGSGILGNALYDGRLVYNRVSMRKVPGSNRRVSRPNPQSEWIVQPVPQLRIVDADSFAAVQGIKAERGKARPEYSRRRRHLLAGLLRCGCCGSAMSLNNTDHAGRRIYCSRRKEGGRCENGKTYKLAPIEQRVIAALQAQLADPSAIARYLETYQAERKRLAAGARAQRGATERRLDQVAREIDRLIAAVARGTIEDAEVRTRIAPLREQRADLEAELAALPAEQKTVALHPAMVARYHTAIGDLAETLMHPVTAANADATKALHELVVTAVIHPEKGEPRIEVKGRLALLTGGDVFPHAVSLRAVVAGSRYRRWQPDDDLASFRFAA